MVFSILITSVVVPTTTVISAIKVKVNPIKASNKKMKFTSSKKAIATISAKGVVKANKNSTYHTYATQNFYG